MTNSNRFVPKRFEYDFDGYKLENHGVRYEEAVECFFNESDIHRNRDYLDRYQLIGQTDAGRKLKIIFQLKRGNVVRIITGWPI